MTAPAENVAVTEQFEVIALVVYVNWDEPFEGDPPHVPPIVTVYPLLGVTVNVVVKPLFTLLDEGLIVPPAPTVDADTV